MDLFGISITEWVGYLAMTTVLISFLMKSVVKLRIINSLGCLVFVLYGFLFSMSIKMCHRNHFFVTQNALYLHKNIYYFGLVFDCDRD